jgi:putative hydrolase of the HAD superfamily
VSVEAITFDVGGTLIQPWPSVGHVYAEAAARQGIRNAPADLLQARFQTAWQARKRFDHSRTGWEQLVNEVFEGLTREPPGRTFFPELYERFAGPEAWRIFEDVQPALAALVSRGIRLGIVSNWDERLRGLLRRLELDACFEAVVVSCEVGASKPDPAIFREAAARLNLPPKSILHVGDSLEMDVHGAEAAGFQARQVRRGAKKFRKRVLTSLTDLVTIIAGRKAKTD